MKSFISTLILTFINITVLYAQANAGKYRIYLDIAHGQRFWNDPNGMVENAGNDLERLKYLTGEMKTTAAALDASIGYIKSKITTEALSDCDLLFIHIPSTPYSEDEAKAIQRYVQNGGALFMVMDADYWSTLEQTNANAIVKPFDIQFGGNSDDTLSGGFTKAGVLTSKPLKVTYHGARTLSGGTPFCFNNQSQEPFGTFKEVQNGGKIVTMGDGMVSLYMTSWRDVADYQCQEFMQEVFGWLLE